MTDPDDKPTDDESDGRKFGQPRIARSGALRWAEIELTTAELQTICWRTDLLASDASLHARFVEALAALEQTEECARCGGLGAYGPEACRVCDATGKVYPKLTDEQRPPQLRREDETVEQWRTRLLLMPGTERRLAGIAEHSDDDYDRETAVDALTRLASLESRLATLERENEELRAERDEAQGRLVAVRSVPRYGLFVGYFDNRIGHEAKADGEWLRAPDVQRALFMPAPEEARSEAIHVRQMREKLAGAEARALRAQLSARDATIDKFCAAAGGSNMAEDALRWCELATGERERLRRDIAELRETIASMNAETMRDLRDDAATIAERDATIQELNEKLGDEDWLVNRCGDFLAERDATIAELQKAEERRLYNLNKWRRELNLTEAMTTSDIIYLLRKNLGAAEMTIMELREKLEASEQDRRDMQHEHGDYVSRALMAENERDALRRKVEACEGLLERLIERRFDPRDVMDRSGVSWRVHGEEWSVIVRLRGELQSDAPGERAGVDYGTCPKCRTRERAEGRRFCERCEGLSQRHDTDDSDCPMCGREPEYPNENCTLCMSRWARRKGPTAAVERASTDTRPVETTEPEPSPTLRAYLALEALTGADDAFADKLRDALDAHWHRLTSDERGRLNSRGSIPTVSRCPHGKTNPPDCAYCVAFETAAGEKCKACGGTGQTLDYCGSCTTKCEVCNGTGQEPTEGT